jgi:DNA mismatch endonuclease, patch repair protein
VIPYYARLSGCAQMMKNREHDRSRSYAKPDARRSRNMRAVRAINTKPERLVRSAAHSLGLRFRLHQRDLPGCPDLVLPRWKTIIFVNGCFWHQHGCVRSKLPRTNPEFWKSKLRRNVARDRANYDLLAKQSWRVIILWECELANSDVAKILKRWFPSR